MDACMRDGNAPMSHDKTIQPRAETTGYTSPPHTYTHALTQATLTFVQISDLAPDAPTPCSPKDDDPANLTERRFSDVARKST